MCFAMYFLGNKIMKTKLTLEIVLMYRFQSIMIRNCSEDIFELVAHSLTEGADFFALQTGDIYDNKRNRCKKV